MTSILFQRDEFAFESFFPEGENSQSNVTNTVPKHRYKIQAGGRQSRELTQPEGQCDQFMRLESCYSRVLVHLGKMHWNQ